MKSAAEISATREKNARRRRIFHWLAKLYELGLQWTPDLAARRKEFIKRIRKMKRKDGT